MCISHTKRFIFIIELFWRQDSSAVKINKKDYDTVQVDIFLNILLLKFFQVFLIYLD